MSLNFQRHDFLLVFHSTVFVSILLYITRWSFFSIALSRIIKSLQDVSFGHSTLPQMGVENSPLIAFETNFQVIGPNYFLH